MNACDAIMNAGRRRWFIHYRIGLEQ